MTTKEIGKQYEEYAQDSMYLWKSVYLHIARICKTYHRTRARKMLLNNAKLTKGMAISSSYEFAAQRLRNRKH